MKKLLLFLLLITSTIAYSQNADFDKLNVRSNFGPPINDTINGPYKKGEFRTRPQDGLWYRYNGKSIGNQRWDYIYFGPSNSIISTLDQVLNRGNLSSLGIQVGSSIFGGIKVPSLGIGGQILMVTVGPDGTFAAQTIPGGGTLINSINTLTASNQFLATSFNVATSPKFLSVTATHTLNLPIANSLDSGIVTPAQVLLWNGKSNLPGSGTSLQYLAGDSTWHTFPIIPAAGNFTTAGGGITITGVWPNLLFTVSGGGGGITGLTGDVTGSGTGAIAVTIQGHVVTYAKMQQVTALRLLGNSTNSTADVQEIGVTSGIIFNAGSLKLDTSLMVTTNRAFTFMRYIDTTTMLSVYFRAPVGSSLQYIKGNGVLATFDTSAIPSFSVKVRSLITANSPIKFIGGVISADTSVGLTHLATQAMLNNYVPLTTFLDSLAAADTIRTNRPLYVIHGTRDTFAIKNDSAAFNAKSLLGRLLNITAPIDGQSLAFQASSGTWIPTTITGGVGTTYTFAKSLNNLTGTVSLVNDLVSPGNNFLYSTDGSGIKGWLAFASQPITTASANGLFSSQYKARVDSTLTIANCHIVGADSLFYSIISHNPAVTDSLYARNIQYQQGNGILIIDASLPQVISKIFKIDTSANVTHPLTQGMASNLYQLKVGTFTNTVSGLVPFPNAAGTTLYLRQDGTWAVPPGGSGGIGTVTVVTAGNLAPIFTTTVNTNTSTPAFVFTLTSSGAHTFLGNNTGSTGTPAYVQPAFTDLAGSIGVSQMNSGTSASATTWWNGTGTWASLPAQINIYNSDGTLTGNRTINLNSNTLGFTNGNTTFGGTLTASGLITGSGFTTVGNEIINSAADLILLNSSTATAGFSIGRSIAGTNGNDFFINKGATNVVSINSSGTFILPGVFQIQSGSPAAGLILTSIDGSGTTSWQLTNNIYNVDGTLTGNRIMTLASNSLTFSGGAINISKTGTFPFTIKSSTQSTINLVAASGTVASGYTLGRSINNDDGQDFFIYDQVNNILRLGIVGNKVTIPGILQIQGGSPVLNASLISDASGNASWGNILSSSTFTSTLTSTANITSSGFLSATYSRNGNIIHGRVSGTMSPTSASTITTLTFTLPITTATTTQNLCGQGVEIPNTNQLGIVGIVNVVSGTTGTFTFLNTSGAGSITTANFTLEFDYTL